MQNTMTSFGAKGFNLPAVLICLNPTPNKKEDQFCAFKKEDQFLMLELSLPLVIRPVAYGPGPKYLSTVQLNIYMVMRAFNNIVRRCGNLLY